MEPKGKFDFAFCSLVIMFLGVVGARYTSANPTQEGDMDTAAIDRMTLSKVIAMDPKKADFSAKNLDLEAYLNPSNNRLR